SNQLLQLLHVEIKHIDQARSQLIVDLVGIFLFEHACFRRNEGRIDAEKFKDAAQRPLMFISQFFAQQNENVVASENVEQTPHLMRVEAAIDIGINAML